MTPHAVGVIVYKVVGNRYLEKRVNLRVEHVKHSKCRQEFLDRVKRNHDAHAAAKAKGGESYFLFLCFTCNCFCALFSYFRISCYGYILTIDPTERVSLKRVHALPREAHTVSIAQNVPQTMRPVAYETTI